MSNEKKPQAAIDEKEFEAAMKEAENSVSHYTHEFAKPFTFEGETFETLSFDFGMLTAADSIAIEAELASIGRSVFAPEISGDYLLRMAMRACTDKRKDGRKLGADAFLAMPLADFNKIRGKARSFLLRSA